MEKSITNKKTLRTIYSDNYACIAEKIRVDENENIVDRWISIRRVGKDGKIVKGKKGIIPIASQTEPITMYGKTHSNKILNFFIYDYLYRNYCTKVVEAEEGIFTLGKPELATSENILKNSKGECFKVEGQDLKYVNQIPYVAGLVARCFVQIGPQRTFNTIHDAFYETYGTESKYVRLPITQKGIEDLKKSYDRTKIKSKGAVAKAVVDKLNRSKESKER